MNKPYYIVLHDPIWELPPIKLNLRMFDTLKQARRHATNFTRHSGESCHIFKAIAHVHPVIHPIPRRTITQIYRDKHQAGWNALSRLQPVTCNQAHGSSMRDGRIVEVLVNLSYEVITKHARKHLPMRPKLHPTILPSDIAPHMMPKIHSGTKQ